MLNNLYSEAVRSPRVPPWVPSGQQRIQRVLSDILVEAKARSKVTDDDAKALRAALSADRKAGKKLAVAFGHAVRIGMFTESEAEELQALLDYRNDLAHRIHLVTSDASRDYMAVDWLRFERTSYKGDALDRLRDYHRSLERRICEYPMIVVVSLKGALFRFVERVYEDEIRRLDRLIRKQIECEHERNAAIRAELNLDGTDLIGDLDPRFPANHRQPQIRGDDYIPPTGHLTKRGVEICYRLFDLGKSPLAVAYLVGMTLKSAERRRREWIKAGGHGRTKSPVERYDPKTYRRLVQT